MRKQFKPAKLHDYNGDLSKIWYIDYGLYSDLHKKLVYKTIKLPTNPKDKSYRYQLAKEICFDIDRKLEKGILYERKKEVKINPAKFLDTVEKLLAEKVEQKQIRQKTAQTYLSACKLLNTFLVSSFSQYNRFVKAQIPNFLSSFNESDSYKKSVLSHLRAVYTLLLEKDFVPINPFMGYVDKIKVTESDFNYPFSDYEKKLLEDYLIANEPRLFLFTRFLFYAFIRPKELLQLQIKDIDLRTKTIRVKGEISKNKRTESIPIVKPLFDLILEFKLMQNPQDFYLFGKNLFPNKKRCGWNVPTNRHRAVLETLGIYVERATVMYSWKHTGNIFAYLAKVDIKLIQRINRHASLETTEIYLRKLGLFLDKNAFDSSW